MDRADFNQNATEIDWCGPYTLLSDGFNVAIRSEDGTDYYGHDEGMDLWREIEHDARHPYAERR